MNRNILRGLKAAEIVTFLISLSVLLALFGHLLSDFLKKSESPFLALEVTIQKELAKKRGPIFIYPVVIENKGGMTAARAVFSVRANDESSHFEVQYLSSGSRKTVYLASEEDPLSLEIKVRLESYQL